VDRAVYYAQCMFGHVFEVKPDTEVEQKCKAHELQGYLDAFVLAANECPDCIEDNRQRERRNATMCGIAGCPLMSLDDKNAACATRCIADQACDDIQDGPYKGQLRGLPASV
jgi:hypothetical protein